jgi:acetylglutamate kinase
VKVLVKLGGTLVDEPAKRAAIATELTAIARDHDLVVVHGGGKQVTRFLEERGVASTFIRGLRVSDEAVIDAVVKVIAGTVNKQIVSAFAAAGAAPVGLSGLDGMIAPAERLHPDLGFVGKPIPGDGRVLKLLSQGGYLPIVACIAGDRDGVIYNVNADQMAVSCAAGWGATKLIFLTDVPGVKGGDGKVVPSLTPEAAAGLIACGVATGGMQAKLEAATLALTLGISEVVVAPGQEPNACGRLLAGEILGTRMEAAR